MTLPLSTGGSGIQDATRAIPAAQFASWTDALEMIRKRHPGVATEIITALDQGHSSPSITVVRDSKECLEAAGFAESFTKDGSVVLEKNSLDGLRRQLTEPERALMLSQGGPMAAEPEAWVHIGVSRRKGLPRGQNRLDARRLEVVVDGLEFFNGAHVSCKGATVGGEALRNEASQFVRSLVWAKAQSAPESTQTQVAHEWNQRWRKILASTAAKSFANTLLEHASPTGAGGTTPSEADVMRDCAHEW